MPSRPPEKRVNGRLSFEVQAYTKGVLVEAEMIRDALDDAPRMDRDYLNWLWAQPSALPQDPEWWLNQKPKCCW